MREFLSMAVAAYLNGKVQENGRELMMQGDGVRLQVTVFGHGSKLALCLHGFPEHAISWRFQIKPLLDLGYQVWVPNLRGYGRSGTPQSVDDYVIEKLLADVASLIDQAKQLGACHEIVLIAHDWGALIGWEFAIKKVRAIDRLIICNVPHPAIMAQHLRRWSQLKKSWYIFMFQVPWIPEWGIRRNGAARLVSVFAETALNKNNFPNEVIEVYRENILKPGGLTGMINYYRANFGRRRLSGFGKGTPDRVEIPVLMLWGENDMALDIGLTEGTEEYVSDLTLRRLPQISHWVQQDAPETVNAMISAWLSGKQVLLAEEFEKPLR